MARKQKTQVNLDRDVAALAKLLESLPAHIDIETRKQVLEESAAPMLAAAKSLAPRSQRRHMMYNTRNKLTKKLRAPKGMGKVVAIFDPGNLGESIQILKHGPFKKSINVHIGPRYPRRRSNNSRLKVAPYAHMVEFGTVKQKKQPYMRPAFEKTKNLVFNLARVKFARKIKEWELKNKS